MNDASLLTQAALLQESRVVIVIAGMEGALPSVVAGLTPAPVIAGGDTVKENH